MVLSKKDPKEIEKQILEKCTIVNNKLEGFEDSVREIWRTLKVSFFVYILPLIISTFIYKFSFKYFSNFISHLISGAAFISTWVVSFIIYFIIENRKIKKNKNHLKGENSIISYV